MGPLRQWAGAPLTLAVLFAAAAPLPAHADEPWQSRAPSALRIEKSENRNQVHYALKVDEQCRLLGDEPVEPYWREAEEGPEARSTLLLIELPAYGVTDQEVVGLHRVRFVVRAFPSRVLEAQVKKDGSGCVARTVARVAGVPSVVERLVLELGPLGPKEVRAEGRRLDNGQPVVERLHR